MRQLANFVRTNLAGCQICMHINIETFDNFTKRTNLASCQFRGTKLASWLICTYKIGNLSNLNLQIWQVAYKYWNFWTSQWMLKLSQDLDNSFTILWTFCKMVTEWVKLSYFSDHSIELLNGIIKRIRGIFEIISLLTNGFFLLLIILHRKIAYFQCWASFS